MDSHLILKLIESHQQRAKDLASKGDPQSSMEAPPLGETPSKRSFFQYQESPPSLRMRIVLPELNRNPIDGSLLLEALRDRQALTKPQSRNQTTIKKQYVSADRYERLPKLEAAKGFRTRSIALSSLSQAAY